MSAKKTVPCSFGCGEQVAEDIENAARNLYGYHALSTVERTIRMYLKITSQSSDTEIATMAIEDWLLCSLADLVGAVRHRLEDEDK